MVGLGLQSAACTVIGIQIGKGNVQKAKSYYRISLVIATIMLSIVVLILSLEYKFFITSFTDSEAVKKQCFSGIKIMIAGAFFDNWSLYLFGIAKGLAT